MKPYFLTKNIYELCEILGLPESEAEKVKIRLTLYSAIKNNIERKKLTHQEAAIITGIGRTVITAIMNGQLQKISTDRLIDVAQALGLKISMKVA